jgi:hypothetical protein
MKQDNNRLSNISPTNAERFLRLLMPLVDKIERLSRIEITDIESATITFEAQELKKENISVNDAIDWTTAINNIHGSDTINIFPHHLVHQSLAGDDFEEGSWAEFVMPNFASIKSFIIELKKIINLENKTTVTISRRGIFIKPEAIYPIDRRRYTLIKLLRELKMDKPLTAVELNKHLNYTESDTVSDSILKINQIFKKKCGADFPLILSKPGYYLNNENYFINFDDTEQ